jgi:2-hydroxy-4-carboxymuconate semialdehyde hemiacetal dehydrogenase
MSMARTPQLARKSGHTVLVLTKAPFHRSSGSGMLRSIGPGRNFNQVIYWECGDVLGMTGIALVGPGAIGAMHAQALAALGCSLRVVVGPDLAAARAFAGQHGFERAGCQLSSAFGSDVDAVVITSPNAVHAQQAVAALAAGKHVLCEIPLGLSLAEAHAVARAARSGQVAAVCHTQRYLPGIARWRSLIQRGEVEPLHLITVGALSRRENVGWAGHRRDWTDSVVWHHGAHAVDTARWLLGDEIAGVTVSSGTVNPETGAVMDVSIGLTTRLRRLATLALSYNADRAISEHTLITSAGTFRLSDSGGGTDRHSLPGTLEDALTAQDESFLRAVRGGPAGDLALVSAALPVYELLERVTGALGAEIAHAARA